MYSEKRLQEVSKSFLPNGIAGNDCKHFFPHVRLFSTPLPVTMVLIRGLVYIYSIW